MKKKGLIPLYLTEFIQVFGFAMIYYGNYMALAETEDLRQFPYWINFTNLFVTVLTLTIFSTLNISLIITMMLASFGIMEEKFKNVPKDVIEIKKAIQTFDNYRQGLNFPLLSELSGR